MNNLKITVDTVKCANIDIDAEYVMDLDIALDHYNKLNRIGNISLYPWDLKTLSTDEHFVPTYKNITIHYVPAKIEKMMKPIVPQKKKKGGDSNAATTVSVYLF